MSFPNKYHIEEWCRLLLAQQTGLTNFTFKHKDEQTDTDDNCIMVDVEIGKRALEYEQTGVSTAWHGKLTITLRARQDMTIAAFEDGWAKVETSLRAPSSTNAATYKAANFPKGFILHDEDSPDDKREVSEQFRHITRVIPFVVEI